MNLSILVSTLILFRRQGMYEELTKDIRKDIMLTALKAGAGHVAPALSVVEILAALYECINVYNTNDPLYEERDKVILSKGHASLALYSILKRKDIISQELLDSFCQPFSPLGGEPKLGEVPGIEASTGSLGHGLSFGVGIAMAHKINGDKNRVYVILGDGECQEGSVWEAALSAAHHKLDNLTVIIDYNHLQAMDDTEMIVSLGSLEDKWKSFGFHVSKVDGHNMETLIKVYKNDIDRKDGTPGLIIAETVKGKGISFMENVPIWHYRMPDSEEQVIANRELGITEEDLR